jgi:chromosome segregation ATPase
MDSAESLPGFDSDEISAIGSVSESISSILRTEKQFNQLHHDILEQGRAIEAFLKDHATRHKMSETFAVLLSLFDLFKTVLTVNLGLRHNLVTERSFNRNRSAHTETDRAFLQEVSAITQTKVASLRDVLTVLNDTIQESVQKTAKLNEVQVSNASLRGECDFLNAQVDEINAQKVLEQAHLRSRLEAAEAAAAELRHKVRTLEDSNSSLGSSLQDIRQRARAEVQKSCETHQAAVNALELRLRRLRTKVAGLRKYVRELKATADTAQSEKVRIEAVVEEHELENSELKSRLEAEREQVSDLKAKLRATERQFDKLETLRMETAILKREVESERQIDKSLISEIQARLDEEGSELQRLRRENRDLRSHKKRLTAAVEDSAAGARRLELERDHLVAAIDELRAETGIRKRTFSASFSEETDEIVMAFTVLRERLGLSSRWSPGRVVTYVLRKLVGLHSGSLRRTGNLRDIDSLRDELS